MLIDGPGVAARLFSLARWNGVDVDRRFGKLANADISREQFSDEGDVFAHLLYLVVDVMQAVDACIDLTKEVEVVAPIPVGLAVEDSAQCC